jgi:hypothetical protein
MKLIFLFTIMLVALNNFGQSQNYLITNTGDTVYGSIKLQNKNFLITNHLGQNQIGADNVQKVYCNNIRGNVVLHCNLQFYSDNILDMDLGYVDLKQKDTVMVLKEILTSDKMNLYFGTDNLRTQYYFYKTPTDSLPVQLVVRYYLDGGLNSYSRNIAAYRGDKSRMHIEVDKGYVNQLKNIMGDCEGITEGIWELLDYRDYSLKKLIRMYNKCN